MASRSKQYQTEGSPISIISVKHAQRVNQTNQRKLDNTANYTDFNGNAVKRPGEFETDIKYEDKTLTTAWKVIDGSKEAIIGTDNIPKLGIQIFYWWRITGNTRTM